MDEAAAVETENPESGVAHVARFLRSVIPTDPWQLVFLAGTILPFISPSFARSSKIVGSSRRGGSRPNWEGGKGYFTPEFKALLDKTFPYWDAKRLADNQREFGSVSEKIAAAERETWLAFAWAYKTF